MIAVLLIIAKREQILKRLQQTGNFCGKMYNYPNKPCLIEMSKQRENLKAVVEISRINSRKLCKK